MEDILKNGKIVIGLNAASYDYEDYLTYNKNTKTYSCRLWDYDIVNEITSSKKYGHYAVVAYNVWYPDGFPKISRVIFA